MPAVWVGAAGSATGWGVIQSLRERRPDARIVAADTNPRHLVAAATDADAFERVPEATDARFAAALHAALAEHEIDVYVPVHDLELIAAAQAREAGRLPSGVACTAPAHAATVLCWDKLETARALEAAGVATPRTAPGTSAWSGPCVVKPRHGVASHGVRLIDGAERTGEERTDVYVVQERCAPPEITIDAFWSADGACFASLARERLEVRAGVATKCRVFFDIELEAIARAVGEATGVRGAFCLQVMRGPGGAWQVTDVNPRPGGATRMSVVCGLDVHGAMVADALGEDPAAHLATPGDERYVLRGYVERVAQP
jgi:carbamoylphosphate synthase large subunit